jgi:3-phosphoshikimate 1-carboxyvinyltransferase
MDMTFSGASSLRGEVTVPPDKSISHRAAILGALAQGKTTAQPFLRSADCMSTLSCLELLGIKWQLDDDRLTIEGEGPDGLQPPPQVLDAGNSATTLRLLAGVLAARPFESVITGDDSLRRRPMGRIIEPLNRMGAVMSGAGGGSTPPLTIKGTSLHGIEYPMEVDSAQVKSAIMLAGLQAEGETRILGSRSSRDHTERMLLLMGAALRFEDDAITIQRSSLSPAHLSIPGDISSASFLLAAAVLLPGSRLLLKGVGLNPTRAGFLSVLNSMGALVVESNYQELDNEPRGDLQIAGATLAAIELEGWRVPAMIDEVPLMAVIGSQARGNTVVMGAGELKVKESDRLAAITEELRKLGARIEELPDGFSVQGPTKLKGAGVDSHGDHRIAMALAVAALCAEGDTTIAGWECVDISFPGFEKILASLA